MLKKGYIEDKQRGNLIMRIYYNVYIKYVYVRYSKRNKYNNFTCKCLEK